MQITVPYGRSAVSASVPDELGVDIVELPDGAAAEDPVAAVRRALAEPVGDTTEVAGARSVAIAVNDKTRPVPHQHLLPPLLEWLAEHGIPDEAVTFFIAVGSHPPMTDDEFSAVIPAEILRRFRIVSHDSEAGPDLVRLGETSRGTPVVANRDYVEADYKVVVGTIEPHQFVGFSGGVKSAAIGLAGLDTINANHTLMVHPDSRIGTYRDNPARQDVEEIGQHIGVDLALNAILDHERQVVEVVAGDPVAVMTAGTPLARSLSQVPVSREFGLVISSPGGHPKDINVYQAQKALASAARIVRPGGTIIVTAACPDGAGSEHYENWVAGRSSRDDVISAFRTEGFRIGPHKAFQIARDTEHARLLVYSEMPVELSRRLLLEPVDDFQAAVDDGLARLSPGDHIAVLPHGALTIPYLTG